MEIAAIYLYHLGYQGRETLPGSCLSRGADRIETLLLLPAPACILRFFMHTLHPSRSNRPGLSAFLQCGNSEMLVANWRPYTRSILSLVHLLFYEFRHYSS